MNKQDLVKRITDFLAGEMEEKEKLELRAAMEHDDRSRQVFEDAKFIWGKLDAIRPKRQPAPRMSERLRSVIEADSGKKLSGRHDGKGGPSSASSGDDSPFPVQPGKM